MSNYYTSIPVQDRSCHTKIIPLRTLPADETRLADSIVTNENDFEDMIIIYSSTTLHHSWGGQRSKGQSNTCISHKVIVYKANYRTKG